MAGLEVPVLLAYQDTRSQRTERAVLVRKLLGVAGPEGFKPVLIVGFCSLRKRVRAFRLDRVIRIADPETGEVIEDVVAYLQRETLRRRPPKADTIAGS
jgi:predicted DNA-binding transcriptional regulator YafY